MLKDVEGLSRFILGFSKNPTVEGREVKVDYDLKPIKLDWLQKLFNVDPNHKDPEIRHLVEGQNFKITREKFEKLRPYIIGNPNFDDYIFFLENGVKTGWIWEKGCPIQIKNALYKISPFINEHLDIKYWNEFHDYIWNNYPFTELSFYRIDWETQKDYNRLSWIEAINSPEKLQRFIKDSCVGCFKEAIIAYGPKEPVILLPLSELISYPLTTLFNEDWGACFIIGAKRNAKGEIKMINECFIEIDCGEQLISTQ